mmetsp:Transcript_22144/g.35764  ORF Transcript_22144/g.35764 Transcript_22144/m.35764 type:complete len:151 (+) Transcript_22144:321-773(+)
MFYSSERFGVTLGNIMLFNSVIVPEHDAVPRVDRQWGNVQFIPCDKGTLACHGLDNTACTLYRNCGDARMRDWSVYCPNEAARDDVSFVTILGLACACVFGLVLFYIIWKLRFHVCSCCYSESSKSERKRRNTIDRIDVKRLRSLFNWGR